MAEKSMLLGKNSPEFPAGFNLYKKSKQSPSVPELDTATTKEEKNENAVESTSFQAYTGDEEDDDEEDSTPAPTTATTNAHHPTLARLQEFIRLANFHLLQLARPEYIFFCRSLPSVYIQEYLLRQEHLSFVRFFHHSINTFFHGDTTDASLNSKQHLVNKWCVFMRTSGELLRLHTDSKLQELLVSPLAEIDGQLDTEDEQYAVPSNLQQWLSLSEKRLQVISLQSIPTTVACEQAVSRVVSSKTQRIIVCIADMRVCTQSQVNVFRNSIDRFVTENNSSRYFFVVVLHFPPEMGVSSRPCYHAVFVKQWDFIYIDSLGVTTGSSTEGDDAEETRRIEADPRTWIAKGFGLPVTIHPSSVADTFSELFYQILQQSCSSLKPTHLRGAKFTQFYDMRLQPAARFALLRSIIQGLPFVHKDIFTKLGNLWTSSLLNYLCTEACRSIQRGQVVGSLLHFISSSLRFMLSPLVHQITKMMCSNYSLEPIASINKIREQDPPFGKELAEVVKLIIVTIEPPSLKDILERNIQPTILLSTQFNFPPRLPMFDIVSDKLIKLSDQAIQNMSTSNILVTPTAFEKALLEMINKEKEFSEVVKFMDTHPRVLRLFQEDFIKRALRMHEMTDVWLDVCISILEGLCIARGGADICHMYLVKKFDHEKMAYLNICLRPLLKLNSPKLPPLPPPNELATKLSESTAINNVILKATVSTLWDRLNQLRADHTSSNEGVEELMENWCHVFRSLRSRLKNRRSLASSLKEKEADFETLLHFDFQMCAFLVALNFNLAPIELLKYLCSQEVTDVWNLILTSSATEERRGLPQLLPLVAVLWKVVSAGSADAREYVERCGVHLVQDMLSYFLRDKGELDSYDDQELKTYMVNVNTFFAACLEKCNLKGQEKPWNELSKLIPKTWITWSIGQILAGKSTKWSNYILDQAAELIFACYEGKAYSYTPRVLDNEVKYSNVLEDSLFYVFLSDYEGHYKSKTLEDACKQYGTLQIAGLKEGRLVFNELQKVAMSFVVLQLVAEQLKLSEFEETVAKWDKYVLTSVRNLLDSSEYNIQYMFQLVPSQTLVNVLKSRQTLEILGVATWCVEENITVQNYALFSFMIETNTQLGKQYANFASLINNGDADAIHAFLRYTIGDTKKKDQDQQSKRNTYRMFIILVSYYNYFNVKKECTPILKLLQKPAFVELMDINGQELGVFKMMANKPPRVPDDIDVLKYLFSYEGRETHTDLSIAHIMVNSMAVCMGSPRDSNHVYIRAFDIPQLARTKGPGSDFHHENWDCGYQLPNGVLPNADIMGNHTGYRLALNALIWAAISWCALVDEEAGCTACVEFKHFLNYWRADGVYKGARDRTDNEKIKFYIVTRAQGFFSYLCQDPYIQGQQIDGVHFLTESLFKLWLLIDNNHKPTERDPALKALYKTAGDAIAYENILHDKVFIQVTENYVNLKKAYQEAPKSNNRLTTIIELQNAQSTRFVSPLVPFNEFQAHFASHQVRKQKKPVIVKEEPEEITEGKEGEQKAEEQIIANKKLLPYFLEERVKLRALVHLPVLVSFYKILRESFAYIFTAEEALEMSIPTCIDRIRQRDLTLAETLTKSWGTFKEVWANVSELMAEIEGCRDQLANRRFESYIAKVDDETKLASLVTYAKNVLDSYDEIYRLVNALAQKQDRVIEKRDEYGKYNTHHLLFEQDRESADVSLLLANSDSQEMIVTASYDQKEFEMFVLSHIRLDDSFSRSSLRFNIKRIKRQILEQFTCGKCTLTTTNFRQAFNFKIDLKLDDEKNAQGSEPKSNVKDIIGIGPLRKFANALKSGPYSKRFGEDLLQAFNIIAIPDDKEKDELLLAAEFLCQLIQKIIEEDPCYAKQDAKGTYENTKLKDAARDLVNVPTGKLPLIVQQILYFPLSVIQHLAILVDQKYHANEGLYKDLNAQFSDSLSQETLALLAQFENKLLHQKLTEDALRHWKTLIEHLIKKLLSPEWQLVMVTGKALHESIYEQVVVKRLAELPLGDLSEAGLVQVLPRSVHSSQLRAYIRFLHLLLGNIQIKFTAKTNRPPKKDNTAQPAQKLYTEKVPPEVQDVQIHLDNQQANLPENLEGDDEAREEPQAPPAPTSPPTIPPKPVTQKQVYEPQVNTQPQRDQVYKPNVAMQQQTAAASGFAAKPQWIPGAPGILQGMPQFLAQPQAYQPNISGLQMPPQPMLPVYVPVGPSTPLSPSLSTSIGYSSGTTPTGSPSPSPRPTRSSSIGVAPIHFPIPANLPVSPGKANSNVNAPVSGTNVPTAKAAPARSAPLVQAVVKVFQNKKQVLATRERRVALINTLFEKLYRKSLPEGIILVTDTYEVIDASSVATVESFLKEESTELFLDVFLSENMIEVITSHHEVAWSSLATPSTPLKLLHLRICKHFALDPTKITLTSANSVMPHTEELTLGEWFTARVLKLEVETGGIKVVLVQADNKEVQVTEKPKSTVNQLYTKVANTVNKEPGTFILVRESHILDVDDKTEIRVFDVDSIIRLNYFETGQFLLVRVLQDGKKSIQMGFRLDTRFDIVWTQVMQACPDSVFFPANVGSINLQSPAAMFSEIWGASVQSCSEFVVEAVDRHKVVPIQLEMDENKFTLGARPGTTIGDIFTNSIQSDAENYLFVGHDEAEILPGEADWETTIAEYLDLIKKQIDEDIRALNFKATKLTTFKLRVNNQIHTITYKSTPLDAKTVLEAVQGIAPDLPVTHVCNEDGLVVEGDFLQEAAQASVLNVATQADVRNVTVDTLQLSFMNSTRTRILSAHLQQMGKLDPTTDCLCTPDNIMLNADLQIPPELQVLTIGKIAEMSVKQLEYGEVHATLTVNPTTTIETALPYISFIFAIPPTTGVVLTEKTEEIETDPTLQFQDLPEDSFIVTCL